MQYRFFRSNTKKGCGAVLCLEAPTKHAEQPLVRIKYHLQVGMDNQQTGELQCNSCKYFPLKSRM